jgi:septal ring factor EnvC (AmiA/AmiB activator)
MFKQKIGVITASILAGVFVISAVAVIAGSTQEIKSAKASFESTQSELQSTQKARIDSELKSKKMEVQLAAIQQERDDLKQATIDFEAQKLKFAENYEKQILDLQTKLEKKNQQTSTATTQSSAPLKSTTTEVTSTTTQSEPITYYASCSDMQRTGIAHLYRGEPGYRPELDTNADGVAC